MADFHRPSLMNVEDRMKVKLLFALFLTLSVAAFAQTGPASGAQARSQSPAASASPSFGLPKGLDLPKGLFDPFWDDPAIVAELQLTASQKKQLREAALKQQLAVIDGGADAMKAFVHISAILDAEELDDAAYKQQLDKLSAASGKVIHDIGEMVVTPRRILSPEQYQKLKSLQRAKREAAREKINDAVRPNQKRSEIPPSLTSPLSK
jgi:Spy/CpxP family protein refolding chaperone